MLVARILAGGWGKHFFLKIKKNQKIKKILCKNLQKRSKKFSKIYLKNLKNFKKFSKKFVKKIAKNGCFSIFFEICNKSRIYFFGFEPKTLFPRNF